MDTDRQSPPMGETGTQYLLFEPETGRIIGSYGVLDAETGEYREQGEEDVRAAFETDSLGVLAVDLADAPAGTDRLRQRVDPRERRLVPRPQLRLTAERTQITGDGTDTTEIRIEADEGFDGEIRVRTTAGRLSTPGGRVTMSGGPAIATLTSTAETIERVLITARDPRGVAETASLEIEFA